MAYRSLVLLAVSFVLLLAGCSQSEPLTEADVDAMNDAQAVEMLSCQTRKVIADRGREQGMKHVEDLWIDAVEDDGATVQVALSEEGYNCDELR